MSPADSPLPLAFCIASCLGVLSIAAPCPAEPPVGEPAAAPAPQPDVPAAAAADAPAEPALSPSLPGSDKLNLSFTPYVWLTGVSGKSGVAGLQLNLDQSFLEILDESDSVFGLMGALDIEYKRLVFQVNGTFMHAEFSGARGVAHSGEADSTETANVSAKLDVDAAWFEALGGYRLLDQPFGKTGASRFMIDGFVGGRATDMELDLKATADETLTLPSGITLEKDQEHGLNAQEGWFEPFVGANFRVQFDEHWSVLIRGDIGGFGVDNSAFSWQAVGAVGYRWLLDGWSINAFGGYRALSQDYSREGFTWDATTHGVIFGASFTLWF